MTQGFESFLSTTQYIYSIFFMENQANFAKYLIFYVNYVILLVVYSQTVLQNNYLQGGITIFTLLRVSKARANKGIYHTRQNGDFVQELFKKDADLVYEVTEHNNRFGEKYAFFIIECEEFDNLRCGKTSQTVTTHRSENEIFYDAVYVSEMCEELLKQERPLPSKLENLLSDYLPRFFSRVIQWESKGYDSAATWSYYEWILEHMGKKANDYVQQSTIDSFFKEMCCIHDVWQISRILPSKALSISPETSEAIEKSKKEVQETIEIAKKLLSEKCYKDIKYTVGYIPFVSVYAEDTPCGKIGVHVNLEYEFSVSLAMDNNRGYTTCRLGITKECKEFEENFKRKH